MKRVIGVKGQNFDEFIKHLNETNDKHEVFATQTHLMRGFFYAVVYFDEKEESPLESPKTSDSPSEKQVAFLKKNNIDVPKTKNEATKMIATFLDNLKKENI